MKYADRSFLGAAGVALVGALILFLASVTWLEVIGALVLLAGAALVVAAIATPAFLEDDLSDDRATGEPSGAVD